MKIRNKKTLCLRGEQLFAVALILILAAPAAADTPLTVMSFNIRNSFANDGDNAWKHRKDLVVQTIQTYAPDIAGLQEVMRNQADYLDAALPAYRSFGMDRDGNTRGERMTILYKRNLLAPVETGNFWLSKTPDAVGSKGWDADLPRMVTWARFYHMKDRIHFYVFNTHFDHRGEEARRNAARILAERVAALDPTIPVILLGDFNAEAETSIPWKTLTDAGLKDAWLEATTRKGPPLTISNWTHPQPNQTRRIDWILTKGPITAEHCETVLFNEDGRYPSDHYPVFARLRLAK